jgi:hypothetical protein
MKRSPTITSVSARFSRFEAGVADTQSRPCQAAAEDGVVTVDGPAGVAVTLTPDAAERTADSLKMAARQAREGREN